MQKREPHERRYVREIAQDDAIVAVVAPAAGEALEVEGHLEVDGDTIHVSSPVEMTITLLSKSGRRARIMVSANEAVHLEHVPARAGTVNRKRRTG